jgi:hypothetical protein
MPLATLRPPRTRRNPATSVAARLEGLSEALDLPLDVVLSLAARHEPLLLASPPQLRARLSVLSQQALRLPPRDAAAALTAAPELLAWPAPRLAVAAEAMCAVLSSRGLQPAPMLQARPDLLAQSPITVASKLDALPAALGLSARAARQLVSRRPELLRRSSDQLRRRCVGGRPEPPRRALQHLRTPPWASPLHASSIAARPASPSPPAPPPRYAQLQALLHIPQSFLSELLMAEPRVVCLSAATIRAKFDALVDRCGAGSGTLRGCHM